MTFIKFKMWLKCPSTFWSHVYSLSYYTVVSSVHFLSISDPSQCTVSQMNVASVKFIFDTSHNPWINQSWGYKWGLHWGARWRFVRNLSRFKVFSIAVSCPAAPDVPLHQRPAHLQHEGERLQLYRQARKNSYRAAVTGDVCSEVMESNISPERMRTDRVIDPYSHTQWRSFKKRLIWVFTRLIYSHSCLELSIHLFAKINLYATRVKQSRWNWSADLQL